MFLKLILAFIIFMLLLKMYLKLTHVSRKSKICLVNKVAIVTGGSLGIGYEVVKALATRGCKVYVADIIVDPWIKEKIIKETNNANIIFKYVDFASFKSVRRFAEDIKNAEEKIDILVNNAGTGYGNNKTTEDNLNCCLQINYYSQFLLTHLLIDLFKKSGRILFTSSISAYILKLIIDCNKVPSKQDKIVLAYPLSKYYSIVCSDIFAEKLKGTNITSNCYHPGLVPTSIFRNALNHSYSLLLTLFITTAMTFSYLIGKTAEEAAEEVVYLVSSSEINHVTGEMFYGSSYTCKPWNMDDFQSKMSIWEHSEKAVLLELNEKL